MMKLLHAADLHLDAPMNGFPEARRRELRQALNTVPELLARLCRERECDAVLLAGDVFDGTPTGETLNRFREAMASTGVPVFIAPGNHDYFQVDTLWEQEIWPENVHIFTKNTPESVPVPELDCRIWGAGFRSADCAPLLEGFRAEGPERYQVGVFHGDPTQTASPYNPITTGQIRESGLHYLALGHIHKGDAFRAGDTLCAWPGCPMGRGMDETGVKGVLLVMLGERTEAEFLPLDTPRFYDLETEAGTDPRSAIAALLPPAGSRDEYRITLTGYAEALDTEKLQASFPRHPNLTLRDRTVRETALWGSLDDDTLEGAFFRRLHEELESGDRETVLLAARIARQLLDGQEVSLV